MKQEIFSFGKPELGRLGHEYPTVDSIEVLKNEEIVNCTGGGNHSLFLTSKKVFLKQLRTRNCFLFWSFD
jgi:hypothetical protein